jgi:hypothetical protein
VKYIEGNSTNADDLEIKIQFKTKFENWKVENEQVDDVLIVGVKI